MINNQNNKTPLSGQVLMLKVCDVPGNTRSNAEDRLSWVSAMFIIASPAQAPGLKPNPASVPQMTAMKRTGATLNVKSRGAQNPS